MPENKTKKIIISVGPIPARLDSVKFITNRFKGGLAMRTAAYMAMQADFQVDVIMSRFTDPADLPSDINKLIVVNDVFEYYDWFVANAKNYDAFIMAGAVANLTPVKPWEGKFPSHNYKPGDEFDIKFMIAPRAIDVIKTLNPRACLIGYKLFDEPDENKLADIARHTLKDAKANIIFANTPETAKHHKIAVMSDNSAFKVSFEEHNALIARAIRQEYFRTEITPLSQDEKDNINIRKAMAAVQMFEKTLGMSSDGESMQKYGTIAVPVGLGPMFVTTGRGHTSGPVLIRNLDYETRTVHASGKATLNAPALGRILVDNNFQGVVVHRHFTDPLADKKIYDPDMLDRQNAPEAYVFPGTVDEFKAAVHVPKGLPWVQPWHGYIVFRPFKSVDWKHYNRDFPERYFKPQALMCSLVKHFREKSEDVLEIGGNERPMGNLSYDPYCKPLPGFAEPVAMDDIMDRMDFPCIVCFNAINYLTRDEIRIYVSRAKTFAANTFWRAPDEKTTDREYAVLDKSGSGTPIVRHGLLLPGDFITRHTFYAYTPEDFEGMGLKTFRYGTNSMLVYKNLPETPYFKEYLEKNEYHGSET